MEDPNAIETRSNASPEGPWSEDVATLAASNEKLQDENQKLKEEITKHVGVIRSLRRQLEKEETAREYATVFRVGHLTVMPSPSGNGWRMSGTDPDDPSHHQPLTEDYPDVHTALAHAEEIAELVARQVR